MTCGARVWPGSTASDLRSAVSDLRSSATDLRSTASDLRSSAIRPAKTATDLRSTASDPRPPAEQDHSEVTLGERPPEHLAGVKSPPRIEVHIHGVKSSEAASRNSQKLANASGITAAASTNRRRF